MTPFPAPRAVLLPLLLLPAVPSGLSAQTAEWVFHKTADGLHPDGREQQLMWLMNRARANPAAEGVFLANSGDAGIHSGISYFRINTTLLISEFAQIEAKPPAAFDRRLYLGSYNHSVYLISLNAQNHDGQFDRIRDAGFSYTNARASVFSYSESGLYAHGALNIDWGPGPGNMQTGRGHRAAIMSIDSGILTNVGFAMVPETNPATAIGPYVFSGAYCRAGSAASDHYNRFLVGTVWTDLNANQRYDPGEGLNNIRIQPDQGGFHAVTGIGGGYSIPVTTAGTYSLAFSGPGLISVTRHVQVASESVQVDIETSSLPPVAFQLTARPSPASPGTLLLEWTGGTPPWQVERAIDPAGLWQNLGSATTSPSLATPIAGPRYFYRVRSAR